MASIVVGAFGLLLAFILLKYGIGPDWLSVRVAALFALAGALLAIAPFRVGDWIRQGGQWVANLIGQLVGSFDGAWGAVVAAWLIPALMLLLSIRWFGAMLTGRLAKHVGRAALEEYDYQLVWLGGVALAVFAVTIPGNLGELFRGLVGIAGDVGEAGIRWAVA